LTTKKANIVDLGADESVRDLVGRAAAGDQSAAWFLIHQIEEALRGRRMSEPLFDHAAEFFGELLDIHDAMDGKATLRDLAKAFHKLHLVRMPGQPERDRDEKLMLAARVVLLGEATISSDRAYGMLESLGEFRRSAYRTAYCEQGELLERLSLISEVEAIAGESQEALLQRLSAAGGITDFDLQCALEATKQRRV
jgi:hypothetical protein